MRMTEKKTKKEDVFQKNKKSLKKLFLAKPSKGKKRKSKGKKPRKKTKRNLMPQIAVTLPYSKKSRKRKEEALPIVSITLPYSKRERGRPRKKPSSFPLPKEEVLSLEGKETDGIIKKQEVILDIPKKEIISKKVVSGFILVAIVIIIALMLVMISVLFYNYLKNTGRSLDTNENIERAFVRGDSVHVELTDNLANVREVRFIFLGETEYYLETSDVKLNYEFKASELGLNDLKEIEKVSAVFR